MTSYVPPAKYPPALMTRAAIRPRFHRRAGASRSACSAGSVSRSAVTSAAARPRRRRRLGRELGRIRCRRRVGSDARLRCPQGDRDGGQPGGDPAEDEHERDATEPMGAEAPDRRPEQQPAHLHGAIQAERLTAALGRRRVRQVAAGGRVVQRRRQPGACAQDDERGRSGEGQRQDAEQPGREQPGDHQRHARGPVGKPAEDRLADESGGGPRRDDDAEQRQVDALIGEVQRQDGQQRSEAEPHDELGEQQRQDPAPAVEPGVQTSRGWRTGASTEPTGGGYTLGPPTPDRPLGATTSR